MQSTDDISAASGISAHLKDYSQQSQGKFFFKEGITAGHAALI